MMLQRTLPKSTKMCDTWKNDFLERYHHFEHTFLVALLRGFHAGYICQAKASTPWPRQA